MEGTREGGLMLDRSLYLGTYSAPARPCPPFSQRAQLSRTGPSPTAPVFSTPAPSKDLAEDRELQVQGPQVSSTQQPHPSGSCRLTLSPGQACTLPSSSSSSAGCPNCHHRVHTHPTHPALDKSHCVPLLPRPGQAAAEESQRKPD